VTWRPTLIAVQASLTGHMDLSTLHTKPPRGCPTRIVVDYEDIEPFRSHPAWRVIAQTARRDLLSPVYAHTATLSGW